MPAGVRLILGVLLLLGCSGAQPAPMPPAADAAVCSETGRTCGGPADCCSGVCRVADEASACSRDPLTGELACTLECD